MSGNLSLRLGALSLLATLVLSACGGGGGSGALETPRPGTGADFNTPTSATPKPQLCSANNPYRKDAEAATTTGNLADEKLWLKDYFTRNYLWYKEIPSVDPKAGAYSDNNNIQRSLDNYFEALKTKSKTASGKDKDEFSFTYPTKAWNDLFSGGATFSYGAEWLVSSEDSPRTVRIAYVEAGSPAALSGLQRGDSLVSINGVSVENEPIEALYAKLYPGNMDNRSFIYRRQGMADASIMLGAKNITKSPVLMSKVLPHNGAKVGYLVFNDHISPAEAPLINAITEFKAAGVSDLVLDLRYNGGGYLYLANELAYMIAGSARTSGKIFEKSLFNDKRAAETAQSEQAFRTVNCSLMADYTCSGSMPLPSLDLPRVYVLTSPNTCSASEALINGLRGIDVDVQLVGDTTCGKPYGFFGQDNCGITYLAIEFQGVNAKGFGDYADGLKESCKVSDDLSRALGDPQEGQLAAALTLRGGGSCPVATGLAKTGGALAAPRLHREPSRENRILLPR